MYFGSDNQTGASAKVLEMINIANTGQTHGYGDDKWTEGAISALKEVFECDLEVFFVTTGTAANSLALSCLVNPWETILCHGQAHIINDESTAPEFFSGGARLKPVPGSEGKITTAGLTDYLKNAGDDYPHNSQAGALSITQISEAGLVYTPAEIKDLCLVAKENGLKIHMDGARFTNALAALKCTPAELSWKAGVDVLCLGATKCGALCAEAVIFFDKKLAETFVPRRKRAGQLISKGRLFGAQFTGWLQHNHWLELAGHANLQAAKLTERISAFATIKIVHPVQANEIFATMPKVLATYLEEAGAEFYEWDSRALPSNIVLNDDEMLIRLVTSFATQDEHRDQFCQLIEEFYRNN